MPLIWIFISLTALFKSAVLADSGHSECVRKSIERAEADASVIFTGTIRDLYNDVAHPNMLKANVEVKRVMKGLNIVNTMSTLDSSSVVVWGRRLVVVDGIADPTICESFARKFDTRIFLLKNASDHELKLNSSLVRLTLNNIIRTDAAVHGENTPNPDPDLNPKPNRIF